MMKRKDKLNKMPIVNVSFHNVIKAKVGKNGTLILPNDVPEDIKEWIEKG